MEASAKFRAKPRLIWLFGMLTCLTLKWFKMIWMTRHFGPAQEGDEKGFVHIWRVEFSYGAEHTCLLLQINFKAIQDIF